jgi:hypothetical protein
MNKGPLTFYKVLVYIAWFYFMVCGSIWFYESYEASHQYNLQAFVLMLVFAIQAYVRNKLANLIIGIVCLFAGIMIFLDVLHLYVSFKKGDPVTTDVKLLLAFAIFNLLMSGILIFSYLMFNKEEPV